MIRNEKGLTLIEVMATVVVLSIIILAFTNLSQYHMLSNRKTDHKQIALTIAEQQLNEKRAYIAANFSSLTTSYMAVGSSNTPFILPSYPDYSVYIQQQDFTNAVTYNNAPYLGKSHVSIQGTVLLRDAADASKTKTCLLTVTVMWSD